jgi:putative ubiquitin-RnfH superfamily antitoxin RatB of RatAB toxin-antitoxin module
MAEPAVMLAWVDGDTARQCVLPFTAPASLESALHAGVAAGLIPVEWVTDALAGRVGLALHGVRAQGCDTVEPGDRIELLAPLRIDVRRSRHARVEAARVAHGRGK